MAHIPRHIDDPPSMFLIEVDELVLFSLFLGLGILIGAAVTLSAVGCFSAYILSKVKHTKAEGFFEHFLYWHGILFIKKTPASYMREFIE